MSKQGFLPIVSACATDLLNAFRVIQIPREDRNDDAA